MAVKTITVSTAAELKSALSKATGGETILLASGNYGYLELNSRSKFDITHSAEAPVTIRSADPDQPAVFTSFDLAGASGYTLENLTFDYTYRSTHNIWSNVFKVTGGSDIIIRGSTFDGDVASNRSATEDGRGFGTGLTVSGTKNFTLEDSTIHTFHRGATFGSTVNAVLRGNDIHSIRSDGLNFAAVRGMLIEDNHIHDFNRSLSSGDHSDMIQFWTAGTIRPSTDVVIRGNTLDLGSGHNTQSIFMRNELVDRGQAGTEMFYRNVLIEQNTIYNDHKHGITIGETAGLTIRNNALLHVDGATQGPTGTVSIPAINVSSASTDVTIVNNLTGAVNGASSGPGWTVGNNLIVQDRDQSAPNHYSDLFVSSTLEVTEAGHKFLALKGGLIETLGVGSDALRNDAPATAITPLFHVSTLPADDKVFVFDAASYSRGPGGPITADTGSFVWDFGDGTTATGGIVTHRYATPGKYDVTVSVVQPDGQRTSVSDIVVSRSPDFLRFDAQTGSFGIARDNGEIMSAIYASSLAGPEGAKAIDMGKPGVSAWIDNAYLEDLFGADNFALALRLKADALQQSHGEVIRLQGVLLGSITSAGALVFQVNTSDGKLVTVTSTGVNLLDGLAHDIAIRFDADLGRMTMTVDGRPSASAAVGGDLPKMISAGMTFGNPWTRKNFDGKVEAFDLNVERSDYPVYDGPALPGTGPGTGGGLAGSPLTEAEMADLLTPEALGLDGHVLDGAAMATLRASLLKGDTHLAQDGDRAVLDFDGTGDLAVLGRLKGIADPDHLAVSVEFRRDMADGSAGQLLHNADKIMLAVAGDGFRLKVATADEGMKLFNIGKLGLNDTDWHRATVIVDAEADHLQVFLDDRMVLEDQAHDFVTSLPGAPDPGRLWSAGAGFDGQIAEIRVDDDVLPLPVGSEATAFV